MNYLQTILLLLCLPVLGMAQPPLEQLEGKVSYVSSQSIYVKFQTTQNIQVGDTLYQQHNEELTPVLIVENKSSLSTVCRSISSNGLSKDQVVIAQIRLPELVEEVKDESPEEEKDEDVVPVTDTPTETLIESTPSAEKPLFEQKIRGRISLASYNSMAANNSTNRLQYTFSFAGNHLKNSKFSINTYMSFRHTIGEWDEIKSNIGNGLKVYGLSAQYDFNTTTSLSVGRKINPYISGMGVNDGLQFEKKFDRVHIGAVAGTRPNQQDYLYSYKLPQAAAYVGIHSRPTSKFHQTTLGFVEQWNRSNVDRRLLYVKHRNELIKNVSIISSFEIDLYEKKNNSKAVTFRPTNIYTAFRFRVTSKVRLSIAYDNRNNVIYYETYKSILDQLVDKESRQGLRLSASHRANKMINWGVQTNLRFQKNSGSVSQTYSGYLNLSQIPILKIRASIRGSYMRNSYLDNQTIGVRFSRSLFENKISLQATYRWMRYRYQYSEKTYQQNTVGGSLSFNFTKQFATYLYYEGTIDPSHSAFHRFNIKLMYRF